MSNFKIKGNKKIKKYIGILPIYGCISTGIIYAAIGVIAILSFLKIKDGGADESSLFVFLNDYKIGKIFIWFILCGLICYVIWRVYEAIADPYRYGNSLKGKARRIAIGLSSIADALIAFTAIQVLLGTSDIREDGQPIEQRQMISEILKEDWGIWIIICAGLVIIITAVAQFIYGVTKGYNERLDIGNFTQNHKRIIHFIAWVGYLCRGIIIGIIGFFVIKAGIVNDAQYIVNTDKAFNFIGERIGHLWFILVAIGTIFYGLFMFSMGATYQIKNESK